MQKSFQEEEVVSIKLRDGVFSVFDCCDPFAHDFKQWDQERVIERKVETIGQKMNFIL